MKKLFWRCRGLNPGPLTCKASALPLSYIPLIFDLDWPMLENRFILYHGILFKITLWHSMDLLGSQTTVLEMPDTPVTGTPSITLIFNVQSAWFEWNQISKLNGSMFWTVPYDIFALNHSLIDEVSVTCIPGISRTELWMPLSRW